MLTINLIIPDTSFRIQKTFPKNTKLKEISNFLCDQLNLNYLDTEFDFNHQFQFTKFKQTKTLNQIGIQNKGNLICTLQNAKFEGADFFKSN
jgi:hypothetical protein